MIAFEWANAASVDDAVKLLKPTNPAADPDEKPRPRCWYFRLENIKCRKKGGDTCYTMTGQSKYNAIFPTGPSNIVHPSDLATMLVALGATVTISGPEAPRTIDLENFFVTPEQNI